MQLPSADTGLPTALVRDSFARIAADLTLVVDRNVVVEDVRALQGREGPRCRGSVHIAFKLAVSTLGEERRAALLIPLTEALTLAGLLQLLPEAELIARRTQAQPDAATKHALLELSTFVGGAVDGVLRERFRAGLTVRSLGCQGLRPGRGPALALGDGQELVTANAMGRIGEFPAAPWTLALPVLGA